MDVGSTTESPRPDPVAEAAKRAQEAPKAEDPAVAKTEQPERLPEETGQHVDTVA